MGLLLTIIASAYGACPRVAPPEEAATQLEDAELALAKGDPDAFADGLALVQLTLACSDAPLTTASAARYHRMLGVRAYARGDGEVAAEHFLAARRLEPDAALPVYPPTHDIYVRYRQLEPQGEPDRFENPDDVRFFVDGIAYGMADPRGRHLLQFGPEGEVLQARMLAPGELPPWIEPPPPQSPRSPNRKLPWLASGAGALAVAGGLTAANLLSGQRFLDRTKSSTIEDIERLHTQTNVLGGLAIGFGAVGAGLVVTGVLR